MTGRVHSIQSERGSLPYFAGRREELAALGAQLERIAKNEPGANREGIVLIGGVPGAGKTTLGNRFAADLPANVVCCPTNTADIRHTVDLFHGMARELGEEATARNLTGHDTRSTGFKAGLSVVQAGSTKDHARFTPNALNQLLRSSKAAGMWHNKTLVLLIDELQNVEAQDAANLKVLHEGAHGCPIMVVGMGLQHTREVLAENGISRIAPPLLLNCLNEQDALDVIEGNLRAFGVNATKDCVTALAEASHGFPQHVHCYLEATLEVLGTDRRLEAGPTLDGALDAGNKKRAAYYESRLSAMGIPSPQLPMFTVLDALRAEGRDRLLEIDAMRLFADTEYAGQEVIEKAIAHGVLRREGGEVDFGIPSFRAYMQEKQAEHGQLTQRSQAKRMLPM